MEHMMNKLSESLLDKFSMDFLRSQVLKNAYGNDDTVIAALDPRILIVWYLFFGVVPWFVNDFSFLLGCFLLVMVTTLLARVAGLVLFLFALGVFSQTGYLFLVTLLFGGDASAIAPLLVLTLKVATISLASVTVFSGLDPDRLSNGLMWYGCPERLSFSISYAYRMLPMLMEEFQNVLLSSRPRHPVRQGTLPHLSGEDHHGVLLPPDAQHRQTLPHHGGGPGAAGLSVRSRQQNRKKAKALHPEGVVQRLIVSGTLHPVGGPVHFLLHFALKEGFPLAT